MQGERFSFSRQVENFGIIKRQLQNQLSDTDLQHYLEKALAVLILGSNDYINNYLVPSYGSRAKYKPEQFADLLITHYTKHLMVSNTLFIWIFKCHLYLLLPIN